MKTIHKNSKHGHTNKGIRKINKHWHPNNQQAPASDYQRSISIRKASKHQHQTTKTSKHQRNKSTKQASRIPSNYQQKKYKQLYVEQTSEHQQKESKQAPASDKEIKQAQTLNENRHNKLRQAST